MADQKEAQRCQTGPFSSSLSLDFRTLAGGAGVSGGHYCPFLTSLIRPSFSSSFYHFPSFSFSPSSPPSTLLAIAFLPPIALSASAPCAPRGGVNGRIGRRVRGRRGRRWVVLKGLYLSHHWPVLFTREGCPKPACVCLCYAVCSGGGC